MTTTIDLVRVADAMTAAFAEQSAEGFAELYADNVGVWHNYNQKVQGKVENVDTLRHFFAYFDHVAYEGIQRIFGDDTFVQEHIVRGTTTRGKPFEMPAILVVKIAGDQVAYIAEYMDPSPYAALIAEYATD